jgi:endonuclease-3 related protein
MTYKNLYLQIYEKLYIHFGPQGWWPVTVPKKFIPEYRRGVYSLLSKTQKLEVIMGAILTQNTSWENAAKAIINLHKNNLIDIKELLAIRESELAACIRSSGYFNQKAQKLKNNSAGTPN